MKRRAIKELAKGHKAQGLSEDDSIKAIEAIAYEDGKDDGDKVDGAIVVLLALLGLGASAMTLEAVDKATDLVAYLLVPRKRIRRVVGREYGRPDVEPDAEPTEPTLEERQAAWEARLAARGAAPFDRLGGPHSRMLPGLHRPMPPGLEQ